MLCAYLLGLYHSKRTKEEKKEENLNPFNLTNMFTKLTNVVNTIGDEVDINSLLKMAINPDKPHTNFSIDGDIASIEVKYNGVSETLSVHHVKANSFISFFNKNGPINLPIFKVDSNDYVHLINTMTDDHYFTYKGYKVTVEGKVSTSVLGVHPFTSWNEIIKKLDNLHDTHEQE